MPAVAALVALVTTIAPTAPSADAAESVGSQSVDCPVELQCVLEPAALAQNDPGDPSSYGNYDPATRPDDVDVDRVVVHDTEGTYEEAINTFKNSAAGVSSHYLVEPSGRVTELVRPDDITWASGNWYVNMHAINIEHVGVADEPSSYTPEMYKSSALLVSYLADRYDIPRNRAHIVGHDEVATTKTAEMPDAHWDPGPYWNWNRYMDLVGAESPAADDRGLAVGNVVRIDPGFDDNAVPLLDAKGLGVLPAHGTNVVQVRSGPSDDAPLLRANYVGGSGAAATSEIDDWNGTAIQGQQFVISGQRDGWVSLWFGNQTGWVHGDDVSAVDQAVTVRPKEGKTSIPVYGAALPNAANYPAGMNVRTMDVIYQIDSGQQYVTSAPAKADYLQASTIDRSAGFDGVMVIGGDLYRQIWFNHRIGYVKDTDVVKQS